MPGADPYDARPYTAHAYVETHPGRLAAAARLARGTPPPVETARVLELGCGLGGNLLPMAASLPRATLVGVDRSGRQIAEARRAAAGAGLANVRFVQASFETMAIDAGAFDYVVAHGVLSWIPADLRATLFERTAAALAPGGVACVSFNVLPGWYERLAARDWLRFAGSFGVTPEGAVGSLDWLASQASPELTDYRRRLGAVARRLEVTGAAHAAHEYMAPDQHAHLVTDVLAEAASAGLAYLGDATPQAVAVELLPGAARDRARSLDRAGVEQLVDFVRATAFRRALFVRADGIERRPELDPEAIAGLYLASGLRTAEAANPAAPEETFADGDWAMPVADAAARRALHHLAAVAPASLSFAELARELPAAAAPALARELFDVWLATGGLDVRADAPRFTATPGDRPVACPLARWVAAEGGIVTSRLHHEVLIPDAIVSWVLVRLDGTRTRADLAREARALVTTGPPDDAELARLVEACVSRLAACAVLVA
ncbi:MAG TPA: class I SAM-dependent methyltransferase [Polyangiaceae bacterium]|jgi:SAM-dependent methyltransferase|nr:class I SAM-dependent methyltransferase [Polyangiaceae bacterium]